MTSYVVRCLTPKCGLEIHTDDRREAIAFGTAHENGNRAIGFRNEPHRVERIARNTAYDQRVTSKRLEAFA